MFSLLLPLLLCSSKADPIQVKKSSSVEWAKQQAFSYVLAKHKNSCRSKQPEHYISGINFQEKLFKLNHNYTLARFFRLDDSIWAASKQRQSLNKEEGKCECTVEFSKYLFDNFLVCEIFPKGDRNFIISEVIIFKLENHKTVLVSQQTVNYN